MSLVPRAPLIGPYRSTYVEIARKAGVKHDSPSSSRPRPCFGALQTGPALVFGPVGRRRPGRGLALLRLLPYTTQPELNRRL